MTIKQLIEELKKYPDDMLVVTYSDEYFGIDTFEGEVGKIYIQRDNYPELDGYISRECEYHEHKDDKYEKIEAVYIS